MLRGHIARNLLLTKIVHFAISRNPRLSTQGQASAISEPFVYGASP